MDTENPAPGNTLYLGNYVIQYVQAMQFLSIDSVTIHRAPLIGAGVAKIPNSPPIYTLL